MSVSKQWTFSDVARGLAWWQAGPSPQLQAQVAGGAGTDKASLQMSCGLNRC